MFRNETIQQTKSKNRKVCNKGIKPYDVVDIMISYLLMYNYMMMSLYSQAKYIYSYFQAAYFYIMPYVQGGYQYISVYLFPYFRKVYQYMKPYLPIYSYGFMPVKSLVYSWSPFQFSFSYAVEIFLNFKWPLLGWSFSRSWTPSFSFSFPVSSNLSWNQIWTWLPLQFWVVFTEVWEYVAYYLSRLCDFIESEYTRVYSTEHQKRVRPGRLRPVNGVDYYTTQ